MQPALDIFRALADPTRLRIVALIAAMELSVGELAQVLGQSQPRVSRHVKILTAAGLAERRKEGSWVFLAPGAPALFAPAMAAIAALGGDEWSAADRARLAAVRADRSAAAEAWFAAHADDFDALASLQVGESEVEAAMARILAGRGIGRLVDIGTGTGRILELFGRDATSALGLDRSPEMLRLARAKLGAAGLTRAELRQGDMHALPLPDGSADTVVLHQVLHYAQQPAAAVAEAARLLGDGGRLLVVDLAAHDREELRTRDAHARLGFRDEQMTAWFEAGGLKAGAIDRLDGGLTVKLWLATRETTRGLGAKDVERIAA
ncbi:ArsR/SmtB family transcription factor [Sphingomonas jatrophae]|uniref:ArsR family transcriptional regulator n=1 Tax=Sphingomonas jatrophae TaxID=1166337 RepID=A0A1I6LHD0_9SPHN|nr:metalloregulator ArsR/SmtB family transcription factor [Sphingomonas jatrophae]SFS02708.1 ArsR family transcriptional regulator [Sphingomonas jatrophae]